MYYVFIEHKCINTEHRILKPEKKMQFGENCTIIKAPRLNSIGFLKILAL